ncbi:hypothetical protein D5H75_18685 [Bailinhaonella thermotolerans]|uniref:Uncharacterized protein n=2 Tax=Bailinhaonella thermotolerans TaxID=1070861 RepID=A0A3A4BLD1_9ACTN|nr:hypothetical protein D5H75_18685 [Bailinhaonella thermotolerans]
MVVAALLIAVTGLSGCAGSARDAEAADAARALHDALARRDGNAACALLAPRAAEGLETGGAVCREEILRLDLAGGDVREVRVWGRAAQVRTAGDTLFLTRFASGWRVTAAGCEPRPAEPYDCEVEA